VVATRTYLLQTISPEQLRRFKREAAKGSAQAQFQVGDSFDKCDRKQFPKAAKWYAKAAAQAYAPAQNALGLMYWAGRGVRRDDAAAFALFQSAANTGHTSAQHNLGLMYLEGKAVAKDEALGDAWLRVAAAGGNHVSVSVLQQVEGSMDGNTLALARQMADRMAVRFQVQLALAQ
jgi:TPR repeat protein